MDKGSIIDILAEHLQDTIVSFEKSIDELKSTSDLDETETRDPEDYSQQAESTDMQMRLQLQLDKVNNELALVKSFKTLHLETISHGAVFETDKKWFLVGISTLGAHLEGKDIICFSVDAPIYHLLEGKKPGDTFKLGKETHKILSVA